MGKNMKTKLETNPKNLYETDYMKWIENTIEKLQLGDYSNIDWENLIDELGDMGRK